MSFKPRLSVADTANVRPAEMSCVSGGVFVRLMVGGVRSRWIPLGLRAAPRAHRAVNSTPVPHSARTPLPCSIHAPGFYFPVLGVTRSSRMCGVTRISRSRRFSDCDVKPNSFPRIGRSTRNGIPFLVTVTSVTVSPPITAVSPSLTRIWLSACWVWNVKPMSTDDGWTLDRSAWSSMRICRFAVTCGVTFRLMPVCWKFTVARGAAPPVVGALTSTTRIGTRSANRISAGRLSSVVMVGSAWMSASSTRCNALMNEVSVKLPIAVEKISCSAGLPVVSDWPALPSAESELPPRSTITSVGLKFAVGTSASGTPSRFVSTAFAVRGSGRATSWLKNCAGEVRLVHHLDDAALERHHGEALGFQHRIEGEVPGLVLDLGRDLARDALAHDDGAATEGREPGDDLQDLGVVPRHGDARRPRLRRLPGMGREVQFDRGLRLARLGRGHARGGGGRGRRDRLGRGHPRPGPRPRGERRALRPHAHAHVPLGLLDLIVLEHVEVHDDAHDVRPELRVADVLHSAAVLSVVQRRRRREPRAREIDDESSWAAQGEVLDVHRAAEIDHHLDLAGRRDHADGLHFAIARRRSHHPRACARGQH